VIQISMEISMVSTDRYWRFFVEYVYSQAMMCIFTFQCFADAALEFEFLKMPKKIRSGCVLIVFLMAVSINGKTARLLTQIKKCIMAINFSHLLLTVWWQGSWHVLLKLHANKKKTRRYSLEQKPTTWNLMICGCSVFDNVLSRTRKFFRWE